MSIQQGCLVWGSRVVVSSNLKGKSLKDLHETHPEVSCMKAFRRSMDRNIEKLVFNCETYRINQAGPKKAPVHHWEKTTRGSDFKMLCRPITRKNVFNNCRVKSHYWE